MAPRRIHQTGFEAGRRMVAYMRGIPATIRRTVPWKGTAVNEQRQHTRGFDRSGPVWVAIKVMSSTVSVVLGFLFLAYGVWTVRFLLQQPQGGAGSDGAEGVGFTLWFVPLLLAVLLMLGAFGWRSPVAKIVTIGGAVLAVAMLIVTIVVG